MLVKMLAVTCVLTCSPLSSSFARPAECLVLNGEATRTVLGFEVYRVRLFLSTPSTVSSEILGSRAERKRLEIVLLRDVPSAKFISSVGKSVEENFTVEERGKFSSQLKEFMSCFTSTPAIQSGTVVSLDFHPGQGMVVTKGGRQGTTISDPDFYHAILRLWLGNPPQQSVKAGLLGLPG